MTITTQQLQQGIERAKVNPNSPFAVELRRRIEEGRYDSQLSSLGIVRPVRTEGTFSEPEQEKKGFGAKLRDFAVDVVGGRKLAEGAGLALASGDVQGGLSESQQGLSDMQSRLLKRIRERRDAGEDTSRLEGALTQSRQLSEYLSGLQDDFVESLPSNREVVGSSVRLAGTLIVPQLTKGIVGAAKSAETIGAGIKAGATGGAIAGGIEGGVQGLGEGVEKGGVVSKTLGGVAIGAGVGGLLGGIFGGVSGARASKEAREASKVIDRLTPSAEELSPKQYGEALRRGRIVPATNTTPARYVLSQNEAEVALKYKNLVEKDPAKTIINLGNQIGRSSEDVGAFLQKNNGIFNDGELRNAIAKNMDEVVDIVAPEQQVTAAKDKLVQAFIDSVDKNDMYSLWRARINFDSQIESAFRGSPTLQKDVKLALRNAVQDFIADRTADTTYSAAMREMSTLYRLQDVVERKGLNQRGMTLIQRAINNNPRTAAALKWLGIGLAAEKLGITDIVR